jgi:hypothetical protein
MTRYSNTYGVCIISIINIFWIYNLIVLLFHIYKMSIEFCSLKWYFFVLLFRASLSWDTEFMKLKASICRIVHVTLLSTVVLYFSAVTSHVCICVSVLCLSYMCFVVFFCCYFSMPLSFMVCLRIKIPVLSWEFTKPRPIVIQIYTPKKNIKICGHIQIKILWLIVKYYRTVRLLNFLGGILVISILWWNKKFNCLHIHVQTSSTYFPKSVWKCSTYSQPNIIHLQQYK